MYVLFIKLGVSSLGNLSPQINIDIIAIRHDNLHNIDQLYMWETNYHCSLMLLTSEQDNIPKTNIQFLCLSQDMLRCCQVGDTGRFIERIIFHQLIQSWANTPASFVCCMSFLIDLVHNYIPSMLQVYLK